MEILNQDKFLEEALNELKGNTVLPDIKVKYSFSENSPLQVSFKDGCAHITYSRRIELFRGLSLAAGYEVGKEYEIVQNRHFNSCGAMFDNSRNAVLNLDTAKRLIRIMALMGLDTIMLYTEDTYEIPDYKYFGYMRGRFNRDEIHEIDNYALGFGIELVPCIQTLAHLNQALRWDYFSDINDVSDILLAGEEKTYSFIEAMIKACRNCFASNRIHIGMDEAFLLGCGKYHEKNGYARRYDILLSHLKRIVSICKRYYFKPIIWSDMFVNEAFGKDYEAFDRSEEMKQLLDPDLQLMHWTYWQFDPSAYDKKISCHKKLTDNVGFAGGAVKWIGYVPSISMSLKRVEWGLNSAFKYGVKDVLITAWGDNGGEASPFCALPHMQYYAEFNYNPNIKIEEISERLEICTGEKYSDMLKLELPHFPNGEYKTDCITTSKYLLYNDLLCGLFDLHIGESYPEYYKKCAEEIRKVNSKRFGYVYDTVEKTAVIVSKKCDVSLRLRKAYLEKNKAEVKAIIALIKEIIADVDALHKAVHTQWMTDNKIFGYEVQDIHLGALKTRLNTARERLTAWVKGEIDKISELEEERLPYSTLEPYASMREVNENNWARIVSTGIIN